MFFVCRKDAIDKSEEDLWGAVSVPCFKVCVNGIRKAMEYSQIYPDNTEDDRNSANDLYNKIYNLVESRNTDEMEKFLENSSSGVLI